MADTTEDIEEVFRMFTKDDLKAYQAVERPRYFSTYSSKVWNPPSDEVANRFWRATIHKSGEEVLWDLCDAVKTTTGIHLSKSELVPRSKYEPEMLYPWAKKYESGGQMGDYHKEILEASYRKVRRMFLIKGLAPDPLEKAKWEAVDREDGQYRNKNAGLPTLKSKAEVYPQAIQEAKRLQVNQKMSPPPLVVFHRGKNLEEVRGVQGFPFSMYLLESRFFYPYQQKVIKHHTPYTGGRYDFETSVLLNEVRVKSRFILELDYSNFDGSISSTLIGYAFRILHDSFVMDEQDEKDWSRITRYFVTAPMLCPDGRIYYGRRHGVPSGSCFTQLVDSIVNCILLEYVQRKLKFYATRYFVLGDDVVMGLNTVVDLNQIAAVLSELGIKLNTKKSTLHTSAEDIHYLGHDWCHGRGVRDCRETLVRLCTPERTRKEYHSKNRDERRKAFIERLRSYQEDNPHAWTLLEKVVQFYQMQEARRKDLVTQWRETGVWSEPTRYVYLNNFYGFTQYKSVIVIGHEYNEQSRWKVEKRQVVRGNFRGVAGFF